MKSYMPITRLPIIKTCLILKEFLKKFPDSSRVPQCALSAWAMLISQDDFKKSIASYQILSSKYETSPNVSDAWLNIAACQQQLKDLASAKENHLKTAHSESIPRTAKLQKKPNNASRHSSSKFLLCPSSQLARHCVLEIFIHSQGETSRVGLPTVFVRLPRCPLTMPVLRILAISVDGWPKHDVARR